MSKTRRRQPPRILPQMIILRGREMNAARKAAGLTIEQLGSLSGVGYTNAARTLRYEPLGIALATRVVESLGLSLAAMTASEDERRPADGISPEAWAKFTRNVRIRIRAAVRQAYRDVAAESQRRCWFWPSQRRVVMRRIAVRQLTERGEVSLL